MRILLGLALLLVSFGAHAATKVPNNIPCENFIRNLDGSWTALPYTRAIDIGTVRNYRLESANIAKGQYNIAGIDLWGVIEDKCNDSTRNVNRNSVGTFAN